MGRSDTIHGHVVPEKQLIDDEKSKLAAQNSRLLTQFQANKLELEAKKNWDLFYKRNTTKFFKDRHWTTREFFELIDTDPNTTENQTLTDGESELKPKKNLLEIGCGVGNLVFPLIEDNHHQKYFIYAMDFSPRAIEIVKQNVLYSEDHLAAFACDVTTDDVFNTIQPGTIDIITLVFVLSAIHPDKFTTVVKNMWRLLKPGGVVLFRDYGLHDMAQLRFKAGSKIEDKLYVRQDGTRSYFFTIDETKKLFQDAGFEVLTNEYIHRRTVNFKEGIDAPRIFLQGKYRKGECWVQLFYDYFYPDDCSTCPYETRDSK